MSWATEKTDQDDQEEEDDRAEDGEDDGEVWRRDRAWPDRRESGDVEVGGLVVQERSLPVHSTHVVSGIFSSDIHYLEAVLVYRTTKLQQELVPDLHSSGGLESLRI